MDKNTLETLDYPRLMKRLGGFCRTLEASIQLAQEKPFTEREPWLSLRSKVEAVSQHLQREGRFPEVNFPPVGEYLEDMARQTVLFGGREARDMALFFSSCQRVRVFLSSAEDSWLASRVPELPDILPLIKEILDYTGPEGELLEEKIPSLRNIRKEIGQANHEISRSAREIVGEDRDIWQSTVPTQKDGRIVLPLKRGFKGRLPGIVHDSSGSGATLFLEPLGLVEQNNSLVRLEGKYQEEKLRLLRKWSGKFMDCRVELEQVFEALLVIDCLMARVRLGQSWQGVFVESGEGEIALLEAKHPLLGEEAVPINLSMAARTRSLVISGPNTGGKTVSLKTLGLLILLHQSAVPIPVSPESILPFYSQVFCDIGDQQSLEDNLSTFSGHMARISGILGGCDSDSLVILDELGTGTDPQEGGALAVALMGSFLEKGARILVTTHFPELKNFAFVHEEVQNASMAFDEDSHRPTYRIIPDLPGESHALDMAEQNGIPGAVIQEAKTILGGKQGEAGALIRELMAQKAQYQKRVSELEEKESNYRSRARENDLQILRTRQKEKELRDLGVADISRFLRESRSRLERIIQGLEKQDKAPNQLVQDARNFMEEVQKGLENQREKQEQLDQSILTKREDLPTEILPGMRVRLTSGGKIGEVIQVLGKNRIKVAVGSIKMSMKISEIEIVAQAVSSKPKVEVSTEISGDKTAVLTLDIRGYRLQAALDALEEQIDRAIFGGLKEFSVIHGLGEGVLQRAVKDYLSNRRDVREFYHPRPEEGGYGKTVVVLD